MQKQQNQSLHYREHKKIFESIPIQERGDWIKKMLETEQKTGQYPLFKMSYPSHAKWTYKGTQHHYYSYMNDKQPTKGILFYFHGLNAHGDASAYMAINIAKHCSIDCYALDFKNFGRSGGEQRGYIESFDDLVDQAEAFVQFIVGQQKNSKKVYISGLSMGGSVCFKLALRNPSAYDGAILLSPALRENKHASPFMKKVGKLIGTLFPTWKLVDQKFTEGNKYNQTDYYMNDPYIYKDKVVPGSIRSILNTMEQIEGQFSKFTLPFILIQSGVDKMVDPFQAIDFEKQCQSPDKTVIYFKDMWHSVLSEEEMPQLVEAITEWMSPRVGK